MLRVDVAGEVAANRICEGQLSVLRDPQAREVVSEIHQQEKVHLEKLSTLAVERRIRPTAFSPVWHCVSYGLGVATALMGKEAAMACHSAVETVIAEHYNEQIREIYDAKLEIDESELRETIKQFRDEELGHRQLGLDHHAAQAPLYGVLDRVIQTGCRAAIWLTKRV